MVGETERRRQRVQQEASQRATDGLQPERSDTEEFQAEGRQGGKVPGGREEGREGGRKGGEERGGRGALEVCGQKEEHTLGAVSPCLRTDI